VRPCDRIITVEAGAITEMGSHEELLQAGGRYAQLHAKQTGMSAGTSAGTNAGMSAGLEPAQ
jgi:subfamily B ATP-binding cassette protein HlyB/CyaB